MNNVLNVIFSAIGAFVTAKGTALLKDCAIAALSALGVSCIPGGWWIAALSAAGVLVGLHFIHWNGATAAAAPALVSPTAQTVVKP